jgi:hypothetical protein
MTIFACPRGTVSCLVPNCGMPLTSLISSCA